MSHRGQSHLKMITRARPVSLKPPIQHLLCIGACTRRLFNSIFLRLNNSNLDPEKVTPFTQSSLCFVGATKKVPVATMTVKSQTGACPLLFSFRQYPKKTCDMQS